MKIRKILFFMLMLFEVQSVFSQIVERLICTSEMNDLNYDYETDRGEAFPNPVPTDLLIDEVEDEISMSTASLNKRFSLKNGILTEQSFFCYDYSSFFKFSNYYFTFDNNFISIKSLNNHRIAVQETGSGICFVLKKDGGYIVYAIDKTGKPLAVDTFGKKYNSLEAIEYLKEYDPEKYEKSSARAKELGLKGKFDLYEVLIWGDTYYNTASILNEFWNNREWVYPDLNKSICYDLNGYGYQLVFRDYSRDSKFVCINIKGDWEYEYISLNKYSNILQRLVKGSFYMGDWIVMPTGNAYYLISDKTETEVFRIRNTWDSSNLYALAINGYTEDFYGDYVKEVLPKMSKADLRLLRNTIFALYGVHFKSEDLAKYFDKQVWYTDEGKSSGEVTLPENRQKLVEMILKLEK